MIRVLKKEISAFMSSLIAYLVIGVFLTGIGLLMWVFPDTSVLEYGYADMETLFVLGPYVFMFLIPAITMRSFAEEKKGGTIEMLLTKPLTDWQIILGKYFAALIIVILALIPTLIYYYSIYQLGNPVGNIDTAAVAGSYVGLTLLAGVFVAIGILASSFTTNQIVAFIIAVFLCFLLYAGFNAIGDLDPFSSWALFWQQLGILYHYDALSKGLIDSRDVVYFLSVIVVMLLFTRMILGSRNW
ncbi:MAG: gliding motility-associated ABC transporter permease subunit GldF [Candidatus Cyclobacteriaceae bacterium M2_1C_046]